MWSLCKSRYVYQDQLSNKVNLHRCILPLKHTHAIFSTSEHLFCHLNFINGKVILAEK